MLTRRIGITWQLTDLHGWGIFGLNIAKELILNGPVPPLILSKPYISTSNSKQEKMFCPFFSEQASIMDQIKRSGKQATLNEVVMLHSLGNSFMHSPISDQVLGHTNIGFVFFENPKMDNQALARAKRYDKIIAGSSWNRNLMIDMGLANASFVSQGVDLERFQPRPKAGMFDDKFVVFSGGKLELRKGQDIVLAAFKQFHERHTDTILITNWHNAWAQTARNMSKSPHFSHEPKINADGTLNFKLWVSEAGIPDGAHIDVGAISNSCIPSIMNEANVAVFPNRCEGGTNLVAMEAMACGIPCILSANTGHLDIIGEDNCYPLYQQKHSPPEIEMTGVWGESDIDEIVAHLESIYEDRKSARRRGRAGVAFMRKLSWKIQTKHLVSAIQEYMN